LSCRSNHGGCPKNPRIARKGKGVLKPLTLSLLLTLLAGCHGGAVKFNDFDIPVASDGQVVLPSQVIVENAARLNMEYRPSTFGCHPSVYRLVYSDSGTKSVRNAVRKIFVNTADDPDPLRIVVRFDDVRSDAASFSSNIGHAEASMRITLSVQRDSSVLFTRQNLGYSKTERKISFCNELEPVIASTFTQAMSRALIPLINDAAKVARKIEPR
jgi:hypothetical protein